VIVTNLPLYIPPDHQAPPAFSLSLSSSSSCFSRTRKRRSNAETLSVSLQPLLKAVGIPNNNQRRRKQHGSSAECAWGRGQCPIQRVWGFRKTHQQRQERGVRGGGREGGSLSLFPSHTRPLPSSTLSPLSPSQQAQAGASGAAAAILARGGAPPSFPATHGRERQELAPSPVSPSSDAAAAAAGDTARSEVGSGTNTQPPAFPLHRP
jgi:hypothetical protein